MRDYNNFHELINLTIQMKELLECPNLLGKDWKYKKTKRLVKETNKWLAKNYHKDGINKVKEKHFFGE